MKIPLIATIDSDAVIQAALRHCTLQDAALRIAFETGAQAALMAVWEEMNLRLATLRLEMEERPRG